MYLLHRQGQDNGQAHKTHCAIQEYFAIAVTCPILSELIWVLAPYLDRVIIDKYVTPEKHPLGRTCRSYHHYRHPAALAGVFEFFNMKNSFKVALNLGRDLRQEIFEKSQQLSMNSISKRTAGELIDRVSSNTQSLRTSSLQTARTP